MTSADSPKPVPLSPSARQKGSSYAAWTLISAPCASHWIGLHAPGGQRRVEADQPEEVRRHREHGGPRAHLERARARPHAALAPRPASRTGAPSTTRVPEPLRQPERDALRAADHARVEHLVLVEQALDGSPALASSAAA